MRVSERRYHSVPETFTSGPWSTAPHDESFITYFFELRVLKNWEVFVRYNPTLRGNYTVLSHDTGTGKITLRKGLQVGLEIDSLTYHAKFLSNIMAMKDHGAFRYIE